MDRGRRVNVTMSHFSTVLFDLGNTLFHLDHAFVADTISRHAHRVTAVEVARAEYHAKAAVDAEIRARRIGTDATRQPPYFETILDVLGVPAAACPQITAALQEENAARSLWRVVHEDTPDVLRTLRDRGYTLGVVSNADGRVAAAVAERGLSDVFRIVIDSHVVGVEKPDPRIFQLALRSCDADARTTLFIGDIYEIDVQGARAAGLTALLFDPLGLYATVDCDRIDSLGRLLERL